MRSTKREGNKVECNDLIADPTQGRASKMFMDYKGTVCSVSVCQGLETVLLTICDDSASLHNTVKHQTPFLF